MEDKVISYYERLDFQEKKDLQFGKFARSLKEVITTREDSKALLNHAKNNQYK